jgi:hypothetical protein
LFERFVYLKKRVATAMNRHAPATHGLKRSPKYWWVMGIVEIFQEPITAALLKYPKNLRVKEA